MPGKKKKKKMKRAAAAPHTAQVKGSPLNPEAAAAAAAATAAKAEATTQKHNCKVRTPSAAKTEATIQTEHTTHKHYIFIRCHFGPMLVFPS